MRAAAAYNKPGNTLEPSPISSPDSFILTVPHPLPLTPTAAKDTQVRGAQARGASAKAQAPNRNRPATRLPPKMAPHRPTFLIANPELEIGLSYTKQKLDHISNRQFFAFLKLPDTSFRVSPCRAKRLRRARPASRKSSRTTANVERLIANDMHSPASAIALQCATSIFLIANEFRFAACAFRPSFFRTTAPLFGRFQTPFFDVSLAATSLRSHLFRFFGLCQGTASAVPKATTDAILPIARITRANKVLASGGRGLSPDKSALPILLPIARFIRANGFGLVDWTRFLPFDFRVSAFQRSE